CDAAYLSMPGSFILDQCLKPTGPQAPGNPAAYWISSVLSSRQDLEEEFQNFSQSAQRYFIAAFDKTWTCEQPILLAWPSANLNADETARILKPFGEQDC